METIFGCNQSKWPWHSFVCLVAPEDDQLPLMLSCFVLLITHMNILICTLQGSYLVLTYLCFCIKSTVHNSHFCISFLIFGTQGKVIVCFLLVLLLLLLLVLRVFFSKLLIIFCNVFLSSPFSQNISVRYSISDLKYSSEQILVAFARNPLNMLVIVSGECIT